ncbi:MAG: hypothetical protein ACE5KE_14345 [Methanosarcinales archaeon]
MRCRLSFFHQFHSRGIGVLKKKAIFLQIEDIAKIGIGQHPILAN